MSVILTPWASKPTSGRPSGRGWRISSPIPPCGRTGTRTPCRGPWPWHRSEHGLTQTQLGRILGLDQSQVSRLECAEHVPSFDTLLRIADALGLAIDISIRPKAAARRPAPRAAEGAIVETTDQLVIEVRPAGV